MKVILGNWQRTPSGWKRAGINYQTVWIDGGVDRLDVVVQLTFAWLPQLTSLWAESHSMEINRNNLFIYPKDTDVEQLKAEIDDFLLRAEDLMAFQ